MPFNLFGERQSEKPYLLQCMLNFFNPPDHTQRWEEIQKQKWEYAWEQYKEIRPQLIQLEKKQ